MSEFKPIETGGDWSYIDKLDGQVILDGEWVEVLWPDDTVTKQPIRMYYGSFKYNDMGHEYTGSDEQAYLTAVLHAVQVKIYLRRMKDIKLRRVP